MKPLLPVIACLCVALASSCYADEKKDTDKTREKLVGVWDAVKGELPKGSTVEFTKDGKVKVKVNLDGKITDHDGTYEIDGDALKVVSAGTDGKDIKETWKITVLTDKELVMQKDKEVAEFTRKK